MNLVLEILSDQGEYIEKEIELNVEEDFAIDDLNLDAEMCKVGKHLAYYGELAAEFKAMALRKKHEIERHAAQTAINARKAAAAQRDKITEAMVKELIATDPMYQLRVERWIDAEKASNKLDSFYRSMKSRADVMIALTYKQRTEIMKNAF